MKTLERAEQGNTLASELKRLGVDHPDNGFVSAFTRSLSGNQKSALRSEFRATLERRQRVCQLTGSRIALKASHIKPFDHCVNQEEAVCNANGLFLRADIDHLFDKGYISFDEQRRLMISREIKKPLGKAWSSQMFIAIGETAMRAWLSGGDKCKVKGIRIPAPLTETYSATALRTLQQSRKEAIKKAKREARAREDFMDYHRRHVFKGPQIHEVEA